MSGYRDPDAPQSPFADLFDKFGPTRFVLIIVAAIIWMGSDFWLQLKLDWPDGYGYTCHGKGCWITDMWYSPALLHRHSPYELGLFVCIWVPAAVLIAVIAYRGVRKLRARNSSLYSNPLE